MKVFGYIRVSSLGQRDGDGLTRQTKAIRDYAKAHGLMIEKIFSDEGVTGTTENRPALMELMLSLEENGHGIKTVVIEMMSRLARDLMIQEFILADFKKKGFNLISVADGDDLLNGDPTRTMLRQILGAVSQYEKEMMVLKTRASRVRIRATGKKCEGKKGYADLQPSEFKLAQDLRSIGKSYKYIADRLNSMDRKTASGKPYTERVVLDMLRVETRRAARG